MSDTTIKIRYIQTYPGTEDREGLALLAEHKRLCGPNIGAKTTEHQAHAEQVQYRKVGWNGAPIYEYTCPICGIRWRS